ncbi:MAG: hypothetical protein U0K18_03020, partial [Acutalibacteraceae bacterium]|nr:hypothetical protein [Acutalibacteraceae bacterium]
IIEGDSGLGKHTLTKFIAKAAVCDVEDAPCGVCKNCHLADISSHPDISVTAPEDGKKNISVAQIRSLRNETFVKPHMAKRRVFIIDFADTMNEQSQNALLKVLEEPPGNTFFLLIAESKAALLDTILSRCTVLSLSVPEYGEAEEYILKNHKYPEQQVKLALSDFGGNIGRTLEALNGAKTKTASAAEEFTKHFLSGSDAGMLKTTAEFEKNRVDAALFIKELKTCVAKAAKENYRNLLTAKMLLNFYNELSGFEESLNTNINLSLLFCSLVCKATELSK